METFGNLGPAVAAVMRSELAKAQKNSTWFGLMLGGKSQSDASKLLRGDRPMSIPQIEMAARAFGLKVSDVFLMAEAEATRQGDMPADRRDLG